MPPSPSPLALALALTLTLAIHYRTALVTLTMFRATLLVLFSLSALALASPSRLPRDGQCNGSTLCCDGASYRADSPEGLAVIASHGFDHTDYASDSSVHTSCGDFGLLGGSSCAQSPVCCEGNNIGNGFLGIGIGCSPIVL